MNSYFTPTITSLFQQRTVQVTGKPNYIDAFIKFFYKEEGEETILPSIIVELDFDRYFYEFYYFSNKGIKIDISKRLYELKLDDEFELIANVRKQDGIERKTIYHKQKVNSSNLEESIKNLYANWNQSDAFFFCYACKSLIDADFFKVHRKFRAKCRKHGCKDQIIQPYDGTCFDRFTNFPSKRYKIWSKTNEKGGIDIYHHKLVWTHPHECEYQDILIKKLRKGTTPERLFMVKLRIEDETEFFRTCTNCNHTMDVGHFFNKNTCHSCSTHLYGVMY